VQIKEVKEEEIYHGRGWTLKEAAQRGGGGSILRDINTLTGRGLDKLAAGDPSSAVGWSSQSPEGPSHLSYSVICMTQYPKRKSKQKVGPGSFSMWSLLPLIAL